MNIPFLVEIVPFQPRHLPRVLVIEEASFPEEPYTREIFEDLYEECGDLFVVGKAGRRVAGYAVASRRGRRGELVSIAVAPRARGKGLGAALLRHTLSSLAAAGCRSVHLMVRETNTAAIEFYCSFGFHRGPRAPGYYGRGRAGVHMSLGLE